MFSACWDWCYPTRIGRSTWKVPVSTFHSVFTEGVQPSVTASFRNAAATCPELDLPDSPAGNNLVEEHLHWGKALENQFLIRTVQVCSQINYSNPRFLNTCPYRDIPARQGSLWVRRAFTRAPSSGVAWGAATFLSDPPY